MRCRILHESGHRIRIHMAQCYMTMEEADILESYLQSLPYVADAHVSDRTRDAVILYKKSEAARQDLLRRLSAFSYDDEETRAFLPERSGRAVAREYQNQLALKVMGRVFRRAFLPAPCRALWTAGKGFRFFGKGLACLRRGKLEVPVLDAAAITASILRGDLDTAGSVMFLLEVGEILEEWTYKKSVDDLARSMELKADRVWMQSGDTEVLADVRDIREGDRIVVRQAGLIPLDGRVVEGFAMVNQASMTGESVPVEKKPGGFVYAGTVVEQGQCVIEVTSERGSGRYDQIVRMIEASEKLKSGTETKAYHLADRLVPFSLLGAGVTYLLTQNVNRALAFLMVDFSCALKLSMPLSVLSAIREAGRYDISVKGGKFLEAAAQAETIVFDKTGTLTRATPQVVDIVTFDGATRRQSLRIAACLEEHYPHSVANAVVQKAREEGILHDEMHSQVDYVVAHGISSTIKGKKAIIGSYHFVFEDEKCTIQEEEREKLLNLPA